jgi:hypothetical protein
MLIVVERCETFHHYYFTGVYVTALFTLTPYPLFRISGTVLQPKPLAITA